MHWVVQENIREEKEYGTFIGHLSALKVPHTIVKVIPFSHEMIPEPVLPPGTPVTSWGSVSMGEAAAKRGWKPGCWLNGNFDQRVWSMEYGKYCLNADPEFCTLEQIMPFEGQRFLRPVHDFKAMTGAVVDWEWVKQLQERFAEINVHFREDRRVLCHDTPVSLSPVREIDAESRFFVVDGKVRAGSYYRAGGVKLLKRITAKWEHTGSWDFAQEMAELWQPDRAFVIDVAEIHRDKTSSGNWPDCSVIEINCINHCGFYEADMRPVIKAVEAMLWTA